jgi:hypothetical protein
VTTATSRSCACAAGYTTAATGVCTWSGVVLDPGFQQATSPWTASSGAELQSTGSGDLDPGDVDLAQTTTCTLPAVTQAIVMPKRSRAEPLELAITYAEQDSGGSALPLATGIADVWSPPYAAPTAKFETRYVCLGEGQFAPESSTGAGASTPLVAIGERDSTCVTDPVDVAIDHLEIKPAADILCPEPGTVNDGSAASDGSGWTFTNVSANSSAGFSPFGDGMVTHGILFSSVEACNEPTASTLLSIPLADGSGGSVISLQHDSVNGALHLRIDDRVMTPSVDPSIVTDHYCVPAYMAGGVFAFSAFLGNSDKTCVVVPSDQANTAFVSNVVLSRDPLCGGDPGIANPGFEASETVIGLVVTTGGTATATVAIDAGAYKGAHDLQLAVNQQCGDAHYSVPVKPPPPSSAGGPAVTFYYEWGGGPNDGVATARRSGANPTALTPSLSWSQATVCLDPTTGTLPTTVFIDLVDPTVGSGAACAGGVNESMKIDELATVNTPACPSS